LKCKPERFQKRKNKKKREKRSRRRLGSSEEPGCASCEYAQAYDCHGCSGNIAAISTQADF
jgi:hypothetical protein